MNAKVMQRLAWKDFRTVAPLFWIAIGGIVLLNLLLVMVIVSAADRFPERLNYAYPIWMMLPILFAFGVPAMLVGNEEESGSLAWLKTLPANWKSIALSKSFVASGLLIVICAVATACFALMLSITPEEMLIKQGSDPGDILWIAVLQLTFSLIWLFVGFCTAYFFRSPVTALIVSVPIMGFFFGSIAGGAMETGVDVEPGMVFTDRGLALVAATIAGLIGFAVLQSALAWWRLSGPESRWQELVAFGRLASSYQPPSRASGIDQQDAPLSWYGARLMGGRPRPHQAMLWQATRQQLWWLVLFTVTGAIGAVVLAQTTPRDGIIVMVAGAMAAVSLFGIAGLTFHGDSLRNRREFFFDRGIAPGLVWRTRVAPTLLATLVILGFVAFTSAAFGLSAAATFRWSCTILVGYALAQLLSQWSPRPILAFLAAPVLFVIGVVCLVPWLEAYPRAFPLVLIGVPLFLWASFWLCGRWLRGRGSDYSWRLAGVLAVSVCLPYALTLGYRYATLPAEPTEWRQQMLAVDLPEASETLSQVQLSPGALKSGPEYAELPYWTEEQLADFRDRLEKEATSKFSVGRFVSFDELIGYVNGDETVAYEFREDDAGQVSVVKNPETSEAQDRYRKRVLLAAEILLRWSKLVRESAVAGQCDLGYLTRCAEPAHVRVVDWLLLQWQVHPGDEEIAALVAEIPRQELVDRSRRNCILSFWQNHESLKPASLPLGSSTVRGNPPQQWWLGVERMRADRSLDLAVKDALQIIEQPGAPEEWQRYTVHVRDAYLGGGFLALSDWKRADQLTRLLRERVEALKAAK